MRSTISIVFGILAIGIFAPTSHVEAQTPLTMSPAAYQPSSPQNENLLFRAQTGHYGRFYNCDGEESKRNSPHICWKRSHEPQLPFWMGWKERVRHEACQIIQRVIDGSCCGGGGGCACSECQSNGRSQQLIYRQDGQPITQPTPPCGCAQCAGKLPTTDQSIAAADNGIEKTKATAKRLVSSKRFRRSGLIRVTPAATQFEPPVEPPADPRTSIASAPTSRSLFSQLRAKSPAFKQPAQPEERPEFESGQQSVASLSLLERLKIARPAKTQPAPTRQATTSKSTSARR